MLCIHGNLEKQLMDLLVEIRSSILIPMHRKQLDFISGKCCKFLSKYQGAIIFAGSNTSLKFDP